MISPEVWAAATLKAYHNSGRTSFSPPRSRRQTKAVFQEESKVAQCSEVLKSSVPSTWFLWKSKDFLVTREQKLGPTGHRALLEHSLANRRLCLQGATKHAVNNIWSSSQTFFRYWSQNHSLFLLLKVFLNTLSFNNKFLLFCCRSRKPVNSLHVSYIDCFYMMLCLPYWFPKTINGGIVCVYELILFLM